MLVGNEKIFVATAQFMLASIATTSGVNRDFGASL
jgi:hypothetical protein